jgi:LPXTG-motif cell wall-anchored protein
VLLLAVFALGASVVTAPTAVAASPQAGASEAGNEGTDGGAVSVTATPKAEPSATTKAEASATATAKAEASATATPSSSAAAKAEASATASSSAPRSASATPSASAASSATPSGTPTAAADGTATPTPSAEPTTAVPTATASGPTITSDLTDYPPGGTVTLTGAGWKPGEAVTVVVNDTGELSWSLTEKVVADAEGRFTLTFDLPPYYVPDYDVTATGELSGVATTTFTDAASGAWRWWMTDPTPTNNGSVAQGGTISYVLNAQKTTTSSTGFTDAVMTLTLTGNATFTGPTGSLGTNNGTITGIGTKTLTWTGMNLNRTGTTNNTRTITVTATVSSSAPAGTVTSVADDNGDTNGVFYTGSTSRLETTTHTVIGPIVNSCDFATSGSGAYADSICWFDLTGYNPTTASTSGQVVRQSLPGGYTLSATLKASGTTVEAQVLPTWTGAYLGNTASGVGGYYGISGMPAIYQTSGGTITLTLSNITLTNSSGTSVSGFALVGADAESSDNNESITWTSDKTLVSIGTLGNACGGSTNANPGSLVWSNANKTAKCNGRQDGATKTGAAILYSQDPSTFVQEMVGGGLQGVAFGVMVSGIELKKAVVNPVSSSDGFRITVTTSGGTLLGSATANAASNWAADTGQLYWIASGSNQTFTMAETAVSPTESANYDATWACTKNGAAYTPTGASSTSKTATLAFGDFIVCTITNTGPALTLTKRVENAGGGTLTPANWTLSATKAGSAPVISEAPTKNPSTSGTVTTASTSTVVVPAGVPYALGESSTATGAERYAAGAWTCTNAGAGTFTLVGNNLTLGAGNNVTCTITNTYVRTVTVRKTWVNGVNGDKADLVINGATTSPGKATSTSNGNLGSWTDTGNLATATPAVGTTVSVTEVLPSTNRGIYTSQLTCVDGNNAQLTVSGGQFLMPSTSVTCTFTNTAVKPTIAVWKTTAGTAGGPFSFVLTNTVQPTGTVTTGAADVRTQVDGDPTTANAQPFTVNAFGTAVTITESSLSGWLLESASCNNGTGTVGSLTGSTYTIPAADLIAGAVITCDFGNRPLMGTVIWSKVDAGSITTLLKGSEWTLTGPGHPSPGTAVVDCIVEPCTGLDSDPAAGQFSLSLPLGTGYKLVEAKAPVGYRLDATEHTFTVATDREVVRLGAFANQRSTVPALPLTGGTSTDVFVLAGMGLLLAAGLGGWIERRRLLKSP